MLQMRFVIPRRPKWCNRSITQLWRQTISCKKKKRKSGAECAQRSALMFFKIHLVIRLGIQGPNLQEVEGGFYLFSQIWIDKEKISAGVGNFKKASYCTGARKGERERERGEKYLGGNLWRQEIKTPCCEDLKRKKKKKKQGANWVRINGKVQCTVTTPRGENGPGSFHGNDEREMSRLYIHVSIRLKALCVGDTLSNINRLTSCDTGWEMMTRRRFLITF